MKHLTTLTLMLSFVLMSAQTPVFEMALHQAVDPSSHDHIKPDIEFNKIHWGDTVVSHCAYKVPNWDTILQPFAFWTSTYQNGKLMSIYEGYHPNGPTQFYKALYSYGTYWTQELVYFSSDSINWTPIRKNRWHDSPTRDSCVNYVWSNYWNLTGFSVHFTHNNTLDSSKNWLSSCQGYFLKDIYHYTGTTRDSIVKFSNNNNTGPWQRWEWEVFHQGNYSIREYYNGDLLITYYDNNEYPYAQVNYWGAGTLQDSTYKYLTGTRLDSLVVFDHNLAYLGAEGYRHKANMYGHYHWYGNTVQAYNYQYFNSAGDHIGYKYFDSNGDLYAISGVCSIINSLDAEEMPANNLSLYPNPTHGRFNLTLDEFYVGEHYEIVDGLGRSIQRGEINSTTQCFDLTGQPPGVYRISLRHAKGTRTMILLIQ